MDAHKSIGWYIFNVFNIILMTFVSFLILFPYMNVLAVALNDNVQAVNVGFMVIPRSFTLMNFQALMSDPAIIRAALVTLARLAMGVPYAVFIAFITAYVLSKKYLPGRRWIIFILLIPSYIGGGLIPTYILYANLGLLNNFLVYILPTGFGFFGFILLRTYMYTIPESLEESARLDGAGDLTIMFKIFFPLCIPILATLVLFSAVGHWNDWTTTLYFVPNNQWNTLAFELQRILLEQGRIARLIQEAIMRGEIPRTSPGTSQGVRNAQIVVTTLPIIMVYPFLQKYFIKGLLIGGVKE